MNTFKSGAAACKNGEPRRSNKSPDRHQWQKGWDWENYNPSGEKPAGAHNRMYERAPLSYWIDRELALPR